jgi:hypothetical protein
MFCWLRQDCVVFEWTLELLHEIASAKNKSKRRLFANVAITDSMYSDCLAGDKLQIDIQRWLSPPDPWKNYNVAHGLRHNGTGTWFVQGDILSEWKESGPSSLLWIRGKRRFLVSAYLFAEVDGCHPSQRAQGRVCYGVLTVRHFLLENL